MRILSLFLAGCLLAALPVFAAEPAADLGKTPTRIESDSMRYDQAAGTVIFEGKVHVDRPDFKLWSRQLTVYFAPADKAPAKAKSPDKATVGAVPDEAGKISKIVARGDVRIEREGKEGSCQTATYLAQEGVVSMEGNPVLKDGGNTVSGKVVKLFFRDNRSEVLGDEGQRVQAVFSTPKGAAK